MDTKEFLEKFYEIKGIFENAKPCIRKFIEEESPNYNIFKITGVANLEVTTHTPFLMNLLSPFGSHGQGRLFLNEFFRRLNNKAQKVLFSKEEMDDFSWLTQKETEQIDLSIINNLIKKGVFIENKIYSGTHSGQISRYFKRWMEKFSGKGAFVYLAIYDSDKPNDEGFDDSIDSRFSRNVIEKQMIRLSYKNDIRKWLEICSEQIKSPRVRFAIMQYLDVIKNL